MQMPSKLKVLVADDDQGLRWSVKSALETSGRYDVIEAFDGVNALEKLADQDCSVALLDVDMPRKNGLETLKFIKEKNPGTVVIMVTAFASIDAAVQAVRDGAYNYLSKPIQSSELLAVLDRAVEAQALISKLAASAPVTVEEGRKFIGQNQHMQKVFAMIHRLAKVETPVLIRGASGTGKELVARAIHFNSLRKEGKFVAINCSAIPENLFESELFGHEKGAFTGADQRKIGKFQFAEGGTLFLDEVGDLPPMMQVKLLRVLQEKVFTPVGSNREIPTNVRIIAATNRPLEDMMKAGTFREDLFYRLNVIPIFLPSLASRIDDLDSLIMGFIKKFNEVHGKKLVGVRSEAMSILKKHTWPGNIRELENVIEHCFVMEASNMITMTALPEALLKATGTELLEWPQRPSAAAGEYVGKHAGEETDEDLAEGSESLGLDESDLGASDTALDPALAGALDFNAQKEAFEKEFIIKALRTFKGRINQTALHANIPKKTLLRKIEKYGINAKEFN